MVDFGWSLCWGWGWSWGTTHTVADKECSSGDDDGDQIIPPQHPIPIKNVQGLRIIIRAVVFLPRKNGSPPGSVSGKEAGATELSFFFGAKKLKRGSSDDRIDPTDW